MIEQVESVRLFLYVLMAFLTILGFIQGWSILAHKAHREDLNIVREQNEKNHREVAQNHSDLKDDVNKNYVTHDRMTQHVDTMFESISGRMDRMEDTLNKVYDKITG